ncbi:hypothetical protein [Serratia fonticola]|uniref:Uncharacterized protein n=1 Tax=Serratia fonticola TaxID=47917 RepID=A0AAW3WLV9_SERFO|nr:hypothetical protein [Serratia fonticola]MBC3211954.1 hypothetical protein [Serratia fonticola]NYA13515.1 hypothetical protein [Serratia fonticola]NYA33325.1 hypothetical protein [Serratia fonticola]
MSVQSINKENIKVFLIKHKKIFITVFVLFCIYNAITGFIAGPQLPKCNDHELIDKKIPGMVVNKVGGYSAKANLLKITISDVEETLYDKKAGLRQCTAAMTMRVKDNVHSTDFDYQIAWVNEKEGQYQVKILED